jgi:hypothetical protein
LIDDPPTDQKSRFKRKILLLLKRQPTTMVAGGADDRGDGDQQQQQQQPNPQQRQSLRALYARVKSSPLEVVAIDTAGVRPLPSPPSSEDDASPSPSSSSSAGAGGYEQVPLRTRASVLDRELRAVLSAPPTLEGVHGALERAVLNLRATEAFDDAWAEIDGEPQVRKFGLGLRWSKTEGKSLAAKKDAVAPRSATFFPSFCCLLSSAAPLSLSLSHAQLPTKTNQNKPKQNQKRTSPTRAPSACACASAAGGRRAAAPSSARAARRRSRAAPRPATFWGARTSGA